MRVRKLFDSGVDDDPLATLANLFDIAMVFAVALMAAMVLRFDMTEIFSQEDYTIVKNPGKDNMEIITSEGGEIKRYTPSDSEAPGKAGRRVGIAYELEDGKIVYIPE